MILREPSLLNIQCFINSPSYANPMLRIYSFAVSRISDFNMSTSGCPVFDSGLIGDVFCHNQGI